MKIDTSEWSGQSATVLAQRHGLKYHQVRHLAKRLDIKLSDNRGRPLSSKFRPEDFIEWNGKTTREIAELTGFSAEKISVLSRRFNVQRKSSGAGRRLKGCGPPPHPILVSCYGRFKDVDWTKRNLVISREMGLSRERIRQVRNVLDKPKYQSLLEERKKAIDFSAVDFSKSDKELAAFFGVTEGVFTVERRRRHKAKRAEILNRVRAIDWANTTSVEAAKQLGISDQNLYYLRTKLGLFGHPRKKIAFWKKINWKQSNEAIQKKAGCCMTHVRFMRRRLDPKNCAAASSSSPAEPHSA